MAAATPYEVVVLDVMLPDLDGFAVCRAAARAGRLDAGPDADRARRGRRSRDGARRRRRRLPAQAVRGRRAARAAAGAGPPRRAGAARGARGRRPAARPRGRASRGAAATSWRCRRRSSRCSRRSCAAPASCSPATRCSGSLWDHAYENRSNVVDVYVRYLREKIDRPYGRTSLATVRGRGYRLDPA